MEEINQALAELVDAASVLRDAVEKAKPIIEAIEARWGKDVWERHRKSRTE
jgi:dephospho-CoA kinase